MENRKPFEALSIMCSCGAHEKANAAIVQDFEEYLKSLREGVEIQRRLEKQIVQLEQCKTELMRIAQGAAAYAQNQFSPEGRVAFIRHLDEALRKFGA